MKFHYDEHVEIIGGFYKGKKGKVKAFNVFLSIQYLINIYGGKSAYIPGRHLKLIKTDD